MKKNWLFISLITFIVFSCKEKNNLSEESPIPVISIINGQMKELDTSLYQFTKIETINNHSDTTFIRRDEVRKLAQPFLDAPEIANKDYSEQYSEERLIDAEQQTLSITSTAKNEQAEVQKQIVIINLPDLSSGKVNSIFIDRYISNNDSTLQHKLFWEVDKSFTITSIIEKEAQPEIIKRVKVEWQ